MAKFLLQAGESAMLNMFLQEFKEKIINQRGHEFWLLLVKGRHTAYNVTEKWIQLSWSGPAVTEGWGMGIFPR